MGSKMIEGYVVAEDSGWKIPTYARSLLWVNGIQTTGTRGKFSLPISDPVNLTWGTADGPQLAMGSCSEPPYILGWDGTVGVGGFVERLHVLETRGLELVIAEIEGGLLPPGYSHLPTLDDMKAGVFSRQEVTSTTRDFTYTFITLADSILAEYLHHAMVSELAVDCFADLGPHDGHWHELVGLPLLLNAVSVLSPG
jgi:hypothetical protein